MAEYSKRKRTKTKRYISTDEEKYQYKKKKGNKDVLAVFDCIKRAMAERYEEESEQQSDSETSANNTEKDEEIIETTEEENVQTSSLPCNDHNTVQKCTMHPILNIEQPHTNRNEETGIHTQSQDAELELQSAENLSNNSYNDEFIQYSCNEPLIPSSTYSFVSSDSSLSQFSNSMTGNCNSFQTNMPKEGTVSQKNNSVVQLQNISSGQHHDNNIRKAETLQQELKNMRFSMEAGFNAINQILRNQQQQLTEMNEQFKRNINTHTIPKKPEYFPMKSRECLEKFDTCSIEEYQNTISYFIFLGGLNPKECVSAMIKESITDDFAVNITWTGYGNTIEIASRRLTTAIYEALARNTNFPKVLIPELQEAITEGLRNAKQRVRNKEKDQKNENKEKGKRRTLVEKLKENLNMLNK